MAQNLGMHTIEVSLKAGEKTIPLAITRGSMSSAGFLYWSNAFMNYPGLHAKVRTSDKRPSLLVRSETPLTPNGFSLGKLDVDKKNGVRSLKISSFRQDMKAGLGSSIGAQAPDSDWTIPSEVVEESEGLWRVTPTVALELGEYGWYVNFMTGLQGGGLFDFGVD